MRQCPTVIAISVSASLLHGHGECLGGRVESERTPRDQIIDQWLFALAEILLQNSSPIISALHELVLEEIDIGALVSWIT